MLVSNWYSKLRVSVRWKGAVSASFRVYNGVRQGSTLSPSLLSVFINVLIVRLSHLGLGCQVGSQFVGCISFYMLTTLFSCPPLFLALSVR